MLKGGAACSRHHTDHARAVGRGAAIKMCGVPFHCWFYLARLVLKLGESAVICEQIGDRRPSKGVERAVARIVTPGTLTDAALIDDKQDIWLLAVTRCATSPASPGESGQRRVHPD